MKLHTEIRIEDSALLGSYFDLPSDEVQEKISRFREEWIKQEPVVMKKIEEVTGLICKYSLMDAYIVDTKRTDAISSPIIIGAGNDPSDFVRILAHEFIHNLAVDNVQGEDWSARIQALYQEESQQVANHVMVHAILEAVFSQEEIDRDMDYCKKIPAYEKAWQIVKRDGYANIIQKLKNN